MQMIPLYGRKWRGTKEPLEKAEMESQKTGLKLNIQKTKIMTPFLSHHFMAPKSL